MAGPRDLILEPSEENPPGDATALSVGAAPPLPGDPGDRGALLLEAGRRIGAAICLIAALILLVWLVVRWIPWRGGSFVLTGRRVIARWGVLGRNQAAVMLDRVQDASLSRLFPIWLPRGYGVPRLESGAHSEERISEGLHELAMSNATAFSGADRRADAGAVAS